MGADIKAVHALYARYEPKWTRIKTCLDGEDAVKEAGETYLPFPLYAESLDRNSDEFKNEYDVYLDGAHYVNYTRPAAEDLVSSVFRADMLVNKLPTQLEYLDLETTARDIVAEVASYGRVGVLCDYPATEDPTQEQDAENFAYMETYNVLDIINWKVSRKGGIKQLVRVVLREVYYNDDDEEKYRYRELLVDGGIYKVRVYEEDDGDTYDEYIPKAGGKSFVRIPFYFVGAINNNADPDEPPLIGIVNSNLKHYQTWAELNHVQTYIGHPMLAITGAPHGTTKKAKDDGVAFTVGARHALIVEGEGGTASILQAPSAGDIHFKTLEELKKSMIDQGARLKSGDQRNSAEAENTLKIRHSSETSVLAAIAKNVERALEEATGIIALFMKTTLPEDFSIVLNKEYLDPTPDATLVGALNMAVTSGNYRKKDFTAYLQQTGLITDEEEIDSIVAELGETDPFNTGTAAPTTTPSEEPPSVEGE